MHDSELVYVSSSNKNLIYHYTTSDLAIAKILKDGRLKFGLYKNMNDPFEFLHRQMEFSYCDDDLQRSHDVLDKMFIANRKWESLRELCFCCDDFEFSAKNNLSHPYNRGWARSRMWSQYADTHKGVCFVFDKDKLRKAIMDNLTPSTYQMLSDKVSYDDNLEEYHQINTVSEDEINNGSALSNFFTDEKNRKYLFHKLKDYRDEQEYRFLIVDRGGKIDDEEYFVSIKESICGIIVGCNFECAYLQNIKQYSGIYQIPAYWIKWDWDVPKLSRLFLY